MNKKGAVFTFLFVSFFLGSTSISMQHLFTHDDKNCFKVLKNALKLKKGEAWKKKFKEKHPELTEDAVKDLARDIENFGIFSPRDSRDNSKFTGYVYIDDYHYILTSNIAILIQDAAENETLHDVDPVCG